MSDGVKVQEIGHARPARVWRDSEDNWDLRFPRSVRVFSKMAREDSQVTSVLKAISLPIQRAGWQIDPNGAPDDVVSVVSEDLRLRVLGDDPNAPLAPRQGKVSWSEHLQQALLSLTYGFMFFEQVYEERGGRFRLKKLAPRYPSTITKILVADDGGLEGIEQDGDVTIPVNRLVGYCHDPRDASWTGTSVLRPAYKHWVLRDDFLRLEAQVLDRNGMGVPVYTGSELAIDPDADLQHGQEIAETMRSGESAGASIPAGAKLTLVGVNGQLVSPREAIAYHDSMIARGVLAHFLNLEGKGGSYALAETQSDLFIQSLQTTAEWIAETATQYIVEDLVRMAFPGYDGLCPRVTFDPIASKKELTAQDLATLVRDGVFIPDRDLEEDTRRRYSMPAKRPLDPQAGGGSEKKGPDADEYNKLVAAATGLIRAGFEPEAALNAVGLPPVKHTGKEPVTIRDPRISDAEAEVAEAEAAEAEDMSDSSADDVNDDAVRAQAVLRSWVNERTKRGAVRD